MNAMGNARINGELGRIWWAMYARNPPIMTNSPWAMLMTRISPKLRESPRAARRRMEAMLNPLKSWLSAMARVVMGVLAALLGSAGLAGEAQRIVGLGLDEIVGAGDDVELSVGHRLADEHLLVQALVGVEAHLAHRRIDLDADGG